MADYWIAVSAGFLFGLLVGWASLALLAALIVSGRATDQERQADNEHAAQQRADN